MKIFCIAKDCHICISKDCHMFPTKNYSVFVIFTLKILTKRLLTTSLISNNWPLIAKSRSIKSSARHIHLRLSPVSNVKRFTSKSDILSQITI